MPSPSIASFFTPGVDVDQSAFLAWGNSVESDFAALNAWIAAAGNINASKLATGAVTTAKIADANVTTAKIADANVTNAKLADSPAKTVKGSVAGGPPTDVTFAELVAAAGGVGELSNRTSPVIWTDFMGGSLATYSDFRNFAIAGGTLSGAYTLAALANNHPGVVPLTSVATINSGYGFLFSNSVKLSGGQVFDVCFHTPAAFANVLLRFGFHDTLTNADAVDGAYFELNGSGVVVAKTSNNSTRTTSATVATLVVSTWYHARITVNDTATSVVFEIFDDAGTLLGTQTITTNIPSARETGAGFVATIGTATAQVLAFVDYMSVKYGKPLARGALT